MTAVAISVGDFMGSNYRRGFVPPSRAGCDLKERMRISTATPVCLFPGTHVSVLLRPPHRLPGPCLGCDESAPSLARFHEDTPSLHDKPGLSRRLTGEGRGGFGGVLGRIMPPPPKHPP